MRRGAALLVPLLVLGCSAQDEQPTAGAGPTPSATSSTGAAATSAPEPTSPAVSADAEPCPPTYEGDGAEPWVPEPPTTQTAGRLAPDADPVEVVLCRYHPLGDALSVLQGPPVRVDDGLQQVRFDLVVPEEGPPRDCTAGGGPQVPHLARLTYADGDLWVSAVHDPAGCAGAGNGDFTTGSHLGEQLAASYDEGAWVPREDVS